MTYGIVALSAASSALIALALVGAAIPVLKKWQVVDVASARSSHVGVVPRGGGAAVAVTVLTVSVGALSLAENGDAVVVAILGCAALMGGLGLVDDIRRLDVHVRLAAQAVVATLLAVATLQRFDVPLPVGLVYAPALVLFVVGFTNAFNFMDGINGISGLVAAVAASWYALLGMSVGSPAIAVVAAALAGSAVGFLPWNAPRARVFLGDSGSYFIGALLAGLAVVSWSSGAGLLMAVAPLVIYLSDVTVTLLGRLGRREAWHEAHRLHAYQRLVDHGRMTHLHAAATVAAFSAACCGLVLLAPSALAWVGVAACAAVYIALPVLRRRPHTWRVPLAR